jgi:hypothetical protein
MLGVLDTWSIGCTEYEVHGVQDVKDEGCTGYIMEDFSLSHPFRWTPLESIGASKDFIECNGIASSGLQWTPAKDWRQTLLE